MILVHINVLSSVYMYIIQYMIAVKIMVHRRPPVFGFERRIELPRGRLGFLAYANEQLIHINHWNNY